MTLSPPDARPSSTRAQRWLSTLFCLLGILETGACAALGTPLEDQLPNVGDPCVTLDESSPEFAGYSEHEVNIEDGGSCGSVNVCLVHDFRGRATCPTGQLEGEQGECTTPDGTPVVVPVDPQRPGRPAELGMVCSCRCDGPDPAADYCACPDGMRCEELIPAGGQGASAAYTGSYCVY